MLQQFDAEDISIALWIMQYDNVLEIEEDFEIKKKNKKIIAKVSKEAIQILAKRVSEVVDSKKEAAIPTKVVKLITEYSKLEKECQNIQSNMSKISNSLSSLGYRLISKYIDGVYTQYWNDVKYTPNTTYQKIYDDIVLSLEFDKKDLASLEKELLLKYSK